MIGYASGDGLTDLESRHFQIVAVGPVHNGLGPDTRDWTTLPAYRERIDRARRDIENHREHIEWIELAKKAAVVFTADDVRGIVDSVAGVFDDRE